MSDLSEAFGPAGSFTQLRLNRQSQRIQNDERMQQAMYLQQKMLESRQRMEQARKMNPMLLNKQLQGITDAHTLNQMKLEEARQRIAASRQRMDELRMMDAEKVRASRHKSDESDLITEQRLIEGQQKVRASEMRMNDEHALSGERITAAHEHIGQLRQQNQAKLVEAQNRVALLQERIRSAQSASEARLEESRQRIAASRQNVEDKHTASQQHLVESGAITQEKIDASRSRTKETQLTAEQRRADTHLLSAQKLKDTALLDKQKMLESGQRISASQQRTADTHAKTIQSMTDSHTMTKERVAESQLKQAATGQRMEESALKSADAHATFGQRLENLKQSAKIRMQAAERKWQSQDITDQLHQEQVEAKKLDVQTKLRSADQAERAEGVAESMDVGDDPVVNARVYSKKLWQAGLPASAMKADKQVAELTAKEMQARKQAEGADTAKLNTEHKQLVNNGLVMKDLNALFSSVKSPQDWERAKMLAAEQNLPNPYANLPYDPALVKQLKLGTDEGLKRIQIEQKERHLEGQLKNYESEAKNRQSEEQFRTFRERAMNMKVQARGRVPAKSGGKEVAYPSKEAQKIAAQALKQKYPNLPDDELEHYAFDVASQAKAITSKNKGVDPGTALDRAMQQAEQQGDVKTVHHVYKGIFEKLNIGGILDKPDTQAYRPGEKAAAPKQPAKGSAPSAAVDYLKAHPELKAQFKAKYGYLPDEGDDGN